MPHSHQPPARYDYLVIGGGLFGSYAALYLARRGLRVLLIEKEKQLFSKASVVNQARLHGGYHYPRSVATARMSDDNKRRFTEEHRPFIHFGFDKYYAVDKFGSLTDAAQFERFCAYLDIRADRVKAHPLFNFHRIEALYQTTEYTFDPTLLAAHYRQRLADEPAITVWRETVPTQAEPEGGRWRVELQRGTATEVLIVDGVINATYASSNGVNALFGLREINLMHEISEMAFVTSPQLQNLGLTVMDGQYGSLMPYGKSGLLSLSSVAYTHHKVSYANQPVFDCMPGNPACSSAAVSNCNACPVRPRSHERKMRRQIEQYFAPGVRLDYYQSLFTVKSKLKANHIDDGRPTEITQLSAAPPFYCLFAGKINSIYEVEKVVAL